MRDIYKDIKFKAFDLKKKKMSRRFNLPDVSYEGFPKPFVDENGECDTKAKYVILQYIGTRDSTGEDIYEGDIIEDDNIRAVIEWDNHNARWYTLQATNRAWANCKIIGNIYENPELIQQPSR